MSGEAPPVEAMVVLAHHAEALGPKEDPQQPLSLAGRAMADGTALAVAARGVKPAAIWHSGKLRARQTAEAYWRACNPLARFTAVRGLQPGDPPEWLRDQLAGEDGTILVVGHMPHLPALLRLLVPDSAGPFPLHGAVCVVRAGERWTERWRLAPP